VATYMHGPVLARNPALADHLLEQVLGRRLPALEVPDERALRDSYSVGCGVARRPLPGVNARR
jgi:CobQ-like glutamine amidotransferase family enzyme